MTKDQAEIIALQALTFLAEDEKHRGAFLVQTGISPDELREQTSDSEFLGAVLDFLLSDDRRLIACCKQFDWPPELPGSARRELPGSTAGIWQ